MDDQEAVDQAVRNGWDIHTYTRDGKVAAYAMVRGTEIHVKVYEAFKYRIIHRVATQEFIRPIFDRHGFLTTRVPQAVDRHVREVHAVLVAAPETLFEPGARGAGVETHRDRED